MPQHKDRLPFSSLTVSSRGHLAERYETDIASFGSRTPSTTVDMGRYDLKSLTSFVVCTKEDLYNLHCWRAWRADEQMTP